jgi:hypothetical protein
MRKKNSTIFILLFFSTIVNAQILDYAPKFREDVFYLEIQYLLKNKRTGEKIAYGYGKEKYFGKQFILSPNINGKLYLPPNSLQPWIDDKNYLKYASDSMEPFLSKINIFDWNKQLLNSSLGKLKIDSNIVNSNTIYSIRLPENRENTLRNTLSDSFKNTLSGLMIYLSTPDTSTHISFALKSIDNNSLLDNVYYSNNEKEKQATGFFIINSDLPGRRVFGLYFKGKIYPLQNIKKAFVKLNDSLIPGNVNQPEKSSNDNSNSSNKQEYKKTNIVSPTELNDEGKIIRYMQDGKYGYLKKRNNKRITEPVFDNAEIFPNGWFAKTIAYVGQTKYRVNKKGKITKIN